jgi:ATP-dependent Clp protease adaptor protein ClpS
VADVGTISLTVAGLVALGWRQLRHSRRRPAPADGFDTEAEIALHVASHEASRSGRALSSLHVLYGLLQDAAVAAAITAAGGDPDALEDRVLAALTDLREAAPADGELLVGPSVAIAARAGRKASCTDLWAQLGSTLAGRLVTDSALDRGAILFALFHGREPEIGLTDDRDVLVVLRNDHYTTQDFVCEVLRDVFALPADQAAAIMLATHRSGRAVVGRFTAPAARDKLMAARALARPHAFPLWIGVEPA